MDNSILWKMSVYKNCWCIRFIKIVDPETDECKTNTTVLLTMAVSLAAIVSYTLHSLSTEYTIICIVSV